MGEASSGAGQVSSPGLSFLDIGEPSTREPEIRLQPYGEGERRPVVAVGVFDGVHLGHRSLLERAQAVAGERGAPLWVLTFWPHPDTVVGPGPGFGYLLTTLEEKVELLETLGVERVVVINFTPQAAGVGAEEFFDETLLGRLAPCVLVVGFNFSFGRSGRGDPDLLRRLGHRAGLEVVVHPAVRIGGVVVSSSAVRKALAQGDVEKAGLLLGRPPSLAGPVEPGAGRGRTLGFPTANVGYPLESAAPAGGVYVVGTRHGSGVGWLGETEPGVANIGHSPTFNSAPPATSTATAPPGRVQGSHSPGRLEVHLLAADDPPDYGEVIRVFFLKRLRPEKRFSGREELAGQIRLDRAQAARYFGLGEGPVPE